MADCVQGYAEGYYGKLFSWNERIQILDALKANALNTYYYAPKEDALHRLEWRAPYPGCWRVEFRQFCQAAQERGISVVAGVAPGLDFDFADLPAGPDFSALVDKSRQLLADGAHHVSLLMDDIDADFATRCGTMTSEGQAHAQLANALGEQLGQAIWVTPRIYANELAMAELTYLPDFFTTLDAQHPVLYCGSDIIAREAGVQSVFQYAQIKGGKFVLWDNLYANDYCPGRLFVGPWQGREQVSDVLLNPTGMVHTDCLLLSIMCGNMRSGDDPELSLQSWKASLCEHGVPDAFLELAAYFHHPVFNAHDVEIISDPRPVVFDAIEECLWRWKTPLSREWYAFIYGLKLDLLINQGKMSALRMHKTQSAPLASMLTNLKSMRGT